MSKKKGFIRFLVDSHVDEVHYSAGEEARVDIDWIEQNKSYSPVLFEEIGERVIKTKTSAKEIPSQETKSEIPVMELPGEVIG